MTFLLRQVLLFLKFSTVLPGLPPATRDQVPIISHGASSNAHLPRLRYVVHEMRVRCIRGAGAGASLILMSGGMERTGTWFAAMSCQQIQVVNPSAPEPPGSIYQGLTLNKLHTCTPKLGPKFKSVDCSHWEFHLKRLSPSCSLS